MRNARSRVDKKIKVDYNESPRKLLHRSHIVFFRAIQKSSSALLEVMLRNKEY